MKGCTLAANFEGQGWSSRLFTILLILIWEFRYPQKRGVNRKRGGSFGSSSAWEGGGGGWANELPWGRKDLLVGPGVGGKLHRLTIKSTSFKTVVKDFPYTLRVPSNDCFKSIASHKKCIFLKN